MYVFGYAVVCVRMCECMCKCVRLCLCLCVCVCACACLCQRVENRACSRAYFCTCCISLWVSDGGVGVGGWGGCNNVNVDTFLILAFVIFCAVVSRGFRVGGVG